VNFLRFFSVSGKVAIAIFRVNLYVEGKPNPCEDLAVEV
jgi:hypothetical protein